MSKQVFDALDAYLATPEGKQMAEAMRGYREVKEVYDATIEAMYPKPEIVTSTCSSFKTIRNRAKVRRTMERITGKPAGAGER